MRRVLVAMLSLLALSATACHRQDVIPQGLEGKVDRHLRYVEVKSNPDAYRGKLMLAGGKVLSAQRLKEGTQVEVLQIPLSSDLVPEEQQEESKGRFVAIDHGQNVVDPAVLEDNKLVTIVGEVIGSTTIKIDEVEQRVPELEIKHVTVWDRDRLRPYYGYRAPYAWGYGPYYGRALYW